MALIERVGLARCSLESSVAEHAGLLLVRRSSLRHRNELSLAIYTEQENTTRRVSYA